MSFDVNFFWDHGPDATETSNLLNSLKPSFVSQISSVNIASDNAENIKNLCIYCNNEDNCDDCGDWDDSCPIDSSNYNIDSGSYNYKTGQKRHYFSLDSVFSSHSGYR